MVELHLTDLGREVLDCLQRLPLPAEELVPAVHVHDAAAGACGEIGAVLRGAERKACQGALVGSLVHTFPRSKIPVVNMAIPATA